MAFTVFVKKRLHSLITHLFFQRFDRHSVTLLCSRVHFKGNTLDSQRDRKGHVPHYLLGLHPNITCSKALLTTPSEAAPPPRHPKMKTGLSPHPNSQTPSIPPTDLKTLNVIMNDWTAHLTSWSGTEQGTCIHSQSLRHRV